MLNFLSLRWSKSNALGCSLYPQSVHPFSNLYLFRKSNFNLRTDFIYSYDAVLHRQQNSFLSLICF
jgi:hypothetical protein